MLDFVIDNTSKFIASVPKSKRKQYGQFFTSKALAKFMVELFDVDLSLPEIALLDAGSGTGVLTAAWIDMVRLRIIHEFFINNLLHNNNLWNNSWAILGNSWVSKY